MSGGFPGFPTFRATAASGFYHPLNDQDYAPPPGISPPLTIASSLPTPNTGQYSWSSSPVAMTGMQGIYSSSMSHNPQYLPLISAPHYAFENHGTDRHAKGLIDIAPGTSISTSTIVEMDRSNSKDHSFPMNAESHSFHLNAINPSFPVKGKNLSFPRSTSDVKRFIEKLRELISQANQAVSDIISSSKINHDALSLICVDRMNDNLHLSKITKDSIDTKGNLEETDSFAKAKKIFSGLYENLKSKKDLSNAFFYYDAPGVVQMPACIDAFNNENITLPDFAMGEVWTELMSCNESDGDSCTDYNVVQATLLPSQLWSLEKEIDKWKDLPSMCSLVHLEMMRDLKKVKTGDLKRFLLMHLPSHAIVPYRRKQVDHVLFLLVFCLRAVHRIADLCTSKSGVSRSLHEKNEQTHVSGLESQMIEFKVLSTSASWLSVQLSPIFYPASTKNLVFDCYKYALKCAIRCILAVSRASSNTDVGSNSSSQVGSVVSGGERLPEDLSYCLFKTDEGKITSLKAVCKESESLSIVDSVKVDNVDSRKEPEDPSCSAVDDSNNGMSSVGEQPLPLYHLTEAIVALEELASSQRRIKSDSEFFSSSPYHRSVLHKTIVEQAEGLRATRINYRAVLEHDGLMWQKPQNQDSNRNKTKEEILAEERDYKRRRMSYRAKKVKRTPLQVIKDIIESHMEDIVASGGIGCAGRKPEDVPPARESSGRVEHSNDRRIDRLHKNGRRDDYRGRSHSSSTK